MAFEAATSTGPIALHVDRMPDTVALLGEGGRDKLLKLRLRSSDLNKVVPKWAETYPATMARVEAAQRLARLQEHPARGGFGLSDTDQRVTAAAQRLEELAAAEKRLTELQEVRSKAWRVASATLSATEAWLKSGVPPGTALEDFEMPEPKLAKGEDLLEAVERHRQRCRELRASLQQIRGAPYPSSYCKQQARAQIEALAARGKINVGRLVQHGGDLELPSQQLRVGIHGAPGATGFAETLDAALFAWVHKEALLAKVDAEIDGMANNKAALTVEAREKLEAAAAGELLAAERALCALIWRAQGENLPAAEFPADVSPASVLGVHPVARADKPSSGSSKGLSWAWG